jgi:dihydrofolate reductase
MSVTFKMIWAQDSRGGIGLNNQMPWYLPEDFEHFKSTTTGHTVIMGRKTFQAIPKKFRPLPDRRNIVVTRNPNSPTSVEIANEGATIVTLDQVQELAEKAKSETGNQTIYIIGGASIYQKLMPLANEIIVTEIAAEFEVDTYAPKIEREFSTTEVGQWQVSQTGLQWRVVHYRR